MNTSIVKTNRAIQHFKGDGKTKRIRRMACIHVTIFHDQPIQYGGKNVFSLCIFKNMPSFVSKEYAIRKGLFGNVVQCSGKCRTTLVKFTTGTNI